MPHSTHSRAHQGCPAVIDAVTRAGRSSGRDSPSTHSLPSWPPHVSIPGLRGYAVHRFLSPCPTLTHPTDHLPGTNYLPDHPPETLKTFLRQSFHVKPEQGSHGSSGPPLWGLRAGLECWLVKISTRVSRPKPHLPLKTSSADPEMSLLGKFYYKSNTRLL